MATTKVKQSTRTLGTGEVVDANIATDTISIDKISGSAAAAADTFLKKDGTWTAIPSSDTSGLEDDIALLGFKVASNGSLSKYNLVNQTEDAFADQTGIDLSTSTNEVYNTAGFYTGTIAAPVGGIESTYTSGLTDYVVRSFTSGTTDLIFSKAGTVDYLLVAGGGAGGYSAIPGGGGAGGLLTATGLSVSASTYPISVGAGGTGTAGAADNGGNTTGFSLTAIGGGAGGVGPGTIPAQAGGSGGGGDGYSGGGAAGTAGQGNAGGSGVNHGAGGGGGAGAVGANAVSPSGGAGGAGLSNSLSTGVGVFYGGGGGGNKWTGSVGPGGTGGGGAGGGVDGTVNTGGGGGGGEGSGGSGIAVVRWVADSFGPEYNDMTLVSNATTAEATATKGDLVMTYTNGAGTATLNTDLTAEFSADNGSNWTAMTLEAKGTTGSHFIVSAHDVTAGTPGTAMKYRIKTLNQSVSKETRVQAVSLGWS